MNTLEYLTSNFNRGQNDRTDTALDIVRRNAFDAFSRMGIPDMKHEEWKYTRVSNLFKKDYQLPVGDLANAITEADILTLHLPGHEKANELIFVNGLFSERLSVIRSPGLILMSLESAAESQYREIVAEHLGDSSVYLKDGVNAINTALLQEGIFVHLEEGIALEHPIYIYNITDSRSFNIFSQPRSLIYISAGAIVQIIETFITLGFNESFANQVMEVIIERDAIVEFYKIQNDASHTNQVSTTHFRQSGKSYLHTVTISLNGGIVRNNLNIVMDAEHCESHLYGLYLQNGKSHIDNHTVVDNVMPNCLSNEFYKGILDDQSSGVFNGKIFVQRDAQKTNAYQSNKNVLLSSEASVNTKPQLEIFADDVKCSHGCTIGRLDEEGMFYLRSRGISERIARSLLLHGFVVEILDQIKPAAIRKYVDQLISERLEFDIAC